MATIATSVQGRWKDSYASLQQVGLTARANGEEKTQLVTPEGSLIQAGIDAPTAVPTCAAGSGGGSLTNGKFVAYRYVYASSRYPGVENGVTGQGGEQWPRSNPSDSSAVFTVTGTGRVNVTCTKTTRSDIDRIWLYRTTQKDTSADATADAEAGLMFYVASGGNDSIAGTITIEDNTVEGTEQLESDNFTFPTVQYVVYDGTYLWGFGNNELVADVTLDSTVNITLSDATITSWFDGRNAQVCTFDGIDSGGFDGKGSFYFKTTSTTKATLYSDVELTATAGPGASGTTKIRIKGYATTLYRSKPRNPFSSGWTEQTVADDGTVALTPQQWVLNVGGGYGTGMTLIPTDSVLLLHLEAPTRTYRLNLNNADNPINMGLSKQTIDEQHSVGSHFTVFQGVVQGRTLNLGIDAKTFSILASGADSQQVISSDVKDTMRGLVQDNASAYLYHGAYEPSTELNCWWVRRFDDTLSLGYDDTHIVDTLICLHGPTGVWSSLYDPEVSASASIYDPVERKTFIMLGTEQGVIAKGFDNSRIIYADRNSFTDVGMYQRLAGSLYNWNRSDSYGGDFGVFENVNGLGFNGYKISGDYRIVAITSGANSVVEFSEDVDQCLQDGDVIGIVNSSGVLQGEYTVSQTDMIGTGAPLSTPFWYLNAPAVSMGAGYMIPAFSGNWSTFLNPDGSAYVARVTYSGFATGTSASALYLNLSATPRMYNVATGEKVNDINAVFGTKLLYGFVPAIARMRFDLSDPEHAKRVWEIWSSAENVDPNSACYWTRFFNEYSNTASSSFQLKQDTLPGSAEPDSVNWLTKTQVPSTLLNQFGVEFMETGLYGFRLLNATLKVQPT